MNPLSWLPMQVCTRPSLEHYLQNFTGMDPVRAPACAYAQSDGAGMGIGILSLFVFGIVGLGLTVRVQHPAPLVIAGFLSIGVVAAGILGQAAQIAALIFIFAIAGLGLYLYQRAQSSL